MIILDVPMPECCEECPCSYYVLTGEYEGKMICNAMEFKDTSAGLREELARYFVMADDHQPDNCPILMATL